MRTISYDLACNWKLVFQNYSECYHCPLVHPQLDRLSPSDSGRNDLAEGPFLGGYSELRPGTSLTQTGTTTRPPLGEVDGPDLDRVYYYTLFPSLLLSLHRDYAMVHYVEPLAAQSTRVRCAWMFDPAAIAAPGFDPSDAVDFWDLTNRQDWRINELTQLGTGSRADAPGPYSNAEGLLAAFDRHYRDDALAYTGEKPAVAGPGAGMSARRRRLRFPRAGTVAPAGCGGPAGGPALRGAARRGVGRARIARIGTFASIATRFSCCSKVTSQFAASTST